MNLFLEKAIDHKGNLFAQPRKDFSFSIWEFFPQRCFPGSVNEDFLLGTATKILDEFPAGQVEYPGNSFCTLEQCFPDNLARMAIKIRPLRNKSGPFFKKGREEDCSKAILRIPVLFMGKENPGKLQACRCVV